MKNIRKISCIWNIPPEDFEQIVKSSNCLGEVTKRCGLTNKGRNYKTIQRRIDIEKIDCSHFEIYFYKIASLGKKKLIPLEMILVKGSKYNRTSLKKRLLNLGLLKNECEICGLSPEWNGKKLIFILDHINGVGDDNRLENLRMICPNCNSQLDTHCAKKNKKPKRYCLDCNKQLHKTNKTGFCRKCCKKHIDKNRESNKKRPTREQIILDLQSCSWKNAGKKYNVSGTTLRKWAKEYGLPANKSIRNIVI